MSSEVFSDNEDNTTIVIDNSTQTDEVSSTRDPSSNYMTVDSDMLNNYTSDITDMPTETIHDTTEFVCQNVDMELNIGDQETTEINTGSYERDIKQHNRQQLTNEPMSTVEHRPQKDSNRQGNRNVAFGRDTNAGVKTTPMQGNIATTVLDLIQ